MHGQGAWWLHRFYPLDPPPGTYAISAANLMGGIWNSPADFAYFREREPEAVIGHTIYVYTIEPRGSPADLSLAGLQIDQIDPETYRRFGTNDVRPRWFDATSSLIAAPGAAWIAIAGDRPLGPEFAPLFKDVEPIARTSLTDEDRTYALYHFDLAQRMTQAAQQATPLSAKFGDTAEMLGYNLKREGQDLALITTWRAGAQVVAPLQMFVHVLGADGSIVAQQDHLDVPAFGWRAGDVIAQVHRINLPAAAQYSNIAVGLYDPDSNARLPVTVAGQPGGDRLLLSERQP
jgi:hypothetical protein